MSLSLTNEAQWVYLADPDRVAIAACEQILEASNIAIWDNGVFRIVLAGGSTPEQIYTLLAEQPCDWRHWQLYLGDERCLPADDSQRNSSMIKHALTSRISLPPENIHFIPAELGAQAAALIYAKEIRQALPFDLVMLGMGEDGHTASLFPGHHHPQDQSVHAVYEAPKPPPERVSLSTGSLSNTRQLLIIVTGRSKQAALKQWRDGADLPVSRVSSHTKTMIFTDATAMPDQRTAD